MVARFWDWVGPDPMCGRYASSQPPEFIARLFRTVNVLPNIAPSWDIAPS